MDASTPSKRSQKYLNALPQAHEVEKSIETECSHKKEINEHHMPRVIKDMASSTCEACTFGLQRFHTKAPGMPSSKPIHRVHCKIFPKNIQNSKSNIIVSTPIQHLSNVNGHDDTLGLLCSFPSKAKKNSQARAVTWSRGTKPYYTSSMRRKVLTNAAYISRYTHSPVVLSSID